MYLKCSQYRYYMMLYIMILYLCYKYLIKYLKTNLININVVLYFQNFGCMKQSDLC